MTLYMPESFLSESEQPRGIASLYLANDHIPNLGRNRILSVRGCGAGVIVRPQGWASQMRVWPAMARARLGSTVLRTRNIS